MQRPLEFFRDLRALRTPQDMPTKLVRQVQTARMAMRSTLRAMRVKQSTLATQFNKSEGYLSKIINEKEPMPDWFPEAFCYATGNNLLRQFLALQSALEDARDSESWQERRLAHELRETAAA